MPKPTLVNGRRLMPAVVSEPVEKIPEASTTSDTDEHTGRLLRLLIVEDSKSDIALLLLALRHGGFQVTYEAVVTQAAMRAALQHHEWDLITSDHGMPQFSGPAALALTLELCPDVPFIIVSGEIDINLAVSLIKAGALDYVQKTELVRLVPVVERVLLDREARNAKLFADNALVASEGEYRRLFESAQDGILIVDAETGQIQDVNPFLRDLLGFTREEYLGKKLWEVSAFKDSAASKSAFLQLQQKGYIRFDNIPLCAKSGNNIDVEFVSNIYNLGEKKVIQCNIRDITRRRDAEAEIRKLNASLERRVHLRTAQVEALNSELATFNYSVSHDLQAPLRRINGFVMALERVCGDELNAKGKELILEIRASTEHMSTLIQALLKLASLGKVELLWQETDLSSLAHIITTELQQSDPIRHVEFTITEGIVASGNPAMLRVVMENLLGNAWKFTSLLEVAHIEFGFIELADKPNTYFVRDNGAGFDMQYAGKLFGAFQRLHLESEFPGTGIGLASVQRIIHRHGGRIWAESTVGQGAMFCFELGSFENVPVSEPVSSEAGNRLASDPVAAGA
jgi:PAS domain S-box-containing protein